MRWEQTAPTTDATIKVGEKRRTSMHVDGLNIDVAGVLTRTESGFTFTPDKLAPQHEMGGPVDWKRPEYAWTRELPVLRKWMNALRRKVPRRPMR